jgi:hypothetical protein
MKTKEPHSEKLDKFGQMLQAPKGPIQYFIKISSRLFFLLFWPLTKIYPFALMADCGRIFKLRDRGKYRQAVELGLGSLSKYLAKSGHRRPFLKSLEEPSNFMTWFLFSATAECAICDPRAEDEESFSSLAESMGIESSGEEPSEAFCKLARLTWILNLREQAWFWTERAVHADANNAYAHYLSGWFGLHLDKGNPVESCFEAVTKDPELLRVMRNDTTLIAFPDFLGAIEARAKKAGILVI